MSFQNNIPLATDTVSKSQADILGNFAAIKTLVDVNHDTFGSATEGKHKYVSFPVQAAAPAFAAGEDGIYNKAYATTGKNESYIHSQTFAGTSDIPFTASILSQATPALNTNGWTYLPSGIIMRWESVAGNGLSTVTLSPGYPAFSAIFTVLVTPYSSSVTDDNFSVRLVSIDNTTQFKLYFSSRTTSAAAAGGAKLLIIGR